MRRKQAMVLATAELHRLLETAETALSATDPDFAAELKENEHWSQTARWSLREMDRLLKSGDIRPNWKRLAESYRAHRYDPDKHYMQLRLGDSGDSAVEAIRRWIDNHAEVYRKVTVKTPTGSRLPTVMILIFALNVVADRKVES